MSRQEIKPVITPTLYPVSIEWDDVDKKDLIIYFNEPVHIKHNSITKTISIENDKNQCLFISRETNIVYVYVGSMSPVFLKTAINSVYGLPSATLDRATVIQQCDESLVDIIILLLKLQANYFDLEDTAGVMIIEGMLEYSGYTKHDTVNNIVEKKKKELLNK